MSTGDFLATLFAAVISSTVVAALTSPFVGVLTALSIVLVATLWS